MDAVGAAPDLKQVARATGSRNGQSGAPRSFGSGVRESLLRDWSQRARYLHTGLLPTERRSVVLHAQPGRPAAPQLAPGVALGGSPHMSFLRPTEADSRTGPSAGIPREPVERNSTSRPLVLTRQGPLSVRRRIDAQARSGTGRRPDSPWVAQGALNPSPRTGRSDQLTFATSYPGVCYGLPTTPITNLRPWL